MIEFLNLKAINARYKNCLKKSFDDFFESGQYILGGQVSQFENEYSNYCGTKYCIGVSTGLDALKLIFEAYKILGLLKEDDEVIVPANTYIASVLAVSNVGLKPILVEPSYISFNIDAAKIEESITPKTKAILGVHLYGCLYDVEALESLAKRCNLLLIEDSAQAHGAIHLDGRKAGNVSNAAAFSFYPTKNLGALGDAGAVTTNNENLANVILKLRNYGRESSYENSFKGNNCRLDELQAAFLRIKLKSLDTDNKIRKTIAKTYLSNLNLPQIVLPECKDIDQHVFHLFVIRCKEREKLKEYLLKGGVETAIHYPVPVHKQEAYSEFRNLELPITEQIHNEVLSLPLNPLLSNKDVNRIIEVLCSFQYS